MEISPTPLKWYQKTSGILVAGCSGFVTIVLLILAGMVWYYYQGISTGKGLELANKFSTHDIKTVGFTSGQGSGAAQNQDLVDRTLLESSDAPVLGSHKPVLTIVEFVDFKCPNCQSSAPILRQLIAEHGAEVRLISRNAPFESLHPGATRFAQISWCAHQQGRYWALHDYFFAEQARLPVELSPQDLGALSLRIGLDSQKFSNCLSDQRSLIAVNKDYDDARNLGVRGTPTFFVNGQKVEGVIPYTSWEELLQPDRTNQ